MSERTKRALLPVLVGGASAWLATGVLSRQYLGSYGARGERTFRFPNMPDVDVFAEGARRAAPGRAELRRSLSAGDEPVVLYVGRLIGVKRVDLLVDAMDALRRRCVEATLWLVGDGADRAALEARVAELGMPGVRFFGTVETARLPAIYQAADAFVLPSDHEPWGAVVCEAMACSLPVVASDRVGAAPDYVAEDNGGVFPHGDGSALADALARVLRDDRERRAMAETSFRRVSRFAHGECVESFLEAVSAAHGMRRGA